MSDYATKNIELRAKDEEIKQLKALLAQAADVLAGMYDSTPSQAKRAFWCYWLACPNLITELRKAAQ